jgi:hypothetical protein
MAFASVGSWGTVNSATKQTLSLSAGSTAVAGDLIVIAVSKVNTSASDGATNEVVSVTDPSGTNVWIKAGEFCNAAGSANAGAVAAIWYSLLTANIASGSKATITLDPGFNKGAAATAWRFTATAGGLLAVVQPVTTQATVGGTAPSKAISGLTSKQYLFFRAEASDASAVGTFTASASFTKITADATSGGSAINGEFFITTATGATSAPSGTASADRATMFIALHEVTQSATGTMGWTF